MTGLLVFFVLLFAHYVRVLYIHHGLQDPRTLGEWLISYGEGFTRRGLTGEVVLGVGNATGIPAWVLVFTIQASCFAALLAAFLILVRHRNRPLWFLMLVFSPAGFLFPALDFDAVGRKEMMLLAGLAWYIVALRSRRRSSHAGFLAASGLTAAIVTLSHEYIFFYVPYSWGAAWLSRRTYGSSPASAAFVSAGAAAAMGLILIEGPVVPGVALCSDLLSRGFNPSICAAMLDADAGVGEFVARTIMLAREANYLAEYGVSTLIASVPFVVYFRRPAPRHAVALLRFLSFVGVAFAVSLPLFLMSEDWGRIIHVHVMALTLLATCVLADESSPQGIDAPLPLARGPRGGWPRASLLRVGAVAAYANAWGMYHCCDGFVTPGAIQVWVERLTRFLV